MKTHQIGAVLGIAVVFAVGGCAQSPTAAMSVPAEPRFDGGYIMGSGNRMNPSNADSAQATTAVAPSSLIRGAK